MSDTLPTRLDWSITWRGNTWTESDISGGHFAILTMLTGRDDISMIDLDPFVLNDAGAVSDVHGLKVMVLIQMFVAQQITQGLPEEPDKDIELCLAEAVTEVAEASMADEILPALGFKE